MNTNEVKITKIEDNTQYWLFRAGTSSKYLDDFYINHYIGIGTNELNKKNVDDINNEYIDKYTRKSDDTSEFLIKPEIMDQINNRYHEILFRTNEKKLLKKKSQEEDIDIDEVILTDRDKASLNRSSSIQAKMNIHFNIQMKPGDIILVPTKNTDSFYIGIITSDMFDDEIDHISSPEENEYMKSNFLKKRKVKWIKEISISELPEKLYWTKSSHQTILNISDFSESVNSLISNLYIYKSRMHLLLNVGSKEEITSDDWLEFQKALKNITADQNKNITQKQNVQSPGIIELINSIINGVDTLVTVYSVLFCRNKETPNFTIVNIFDGIYEIANKDLRQNRKEKLHLDSENEVLEAKLKNIELKQEIDKVTSSTEKVEPLKQAQNTLKINNKEKGEKI